METMLDYKPTLASVARFNGWFSLTVNYSVQESNLPTPDGNNYFEVKYVILPLGKEPPSMGDYPRLVSLLVREIYTADDIEAIVNNYLANTEDARREFDELQEWRTEAKKIAREALESVINTAAL